MIGKNSAVSNWYRQQLVFLQCFIPVWKLGVCYIQMNIQNKISWFTSNQSISYFPFVRISQCFVVWCTWRKIVNAWFFSSYSHNLSPCPRNFSFHAKSLRIKILLMKAHWILWPVNPMARRVRRYLDQIRLYCFNKTVSIDLSVTQSEVCFIKLKITIFF